MRLIRKRLLYFAVGSVLCVGLALLFVYTKSPVAAIAFAAAALILSALTFQTARYYGDARLISENPILNVGMASVAKPGAKASSGVNVVVSGFGILMDGRPYKFGHGGVKLSSAKIDRESITLSFGGDEKKYSVRLLHGVADKAEIDKLRDRLSYETGVVAQVSGW